MGTIIKAGSLALLVPVLVHGSLWAIAETVSKLGGNRSDYFLAVSAYLLFIGAFIGIYGFLKTRRK